MSIYKKERKLKVYKQSGYKYKETPTIIIKGDYLNALGFEAGSNINVECSEGKIVITRSGNSE